LSKPALGIVSFIAIAFGLAWTAWEIPIRLGVTVGSAWFQLAALPGAFAPAIAAVIVRRWITREGFADAALRINIRAWRYYLVALLLPLAVVLVICALASALSIGRPDFSIQHALLGLSAGRASTSKIPQDLIGILILPQLLVTAVIVTPVLWGEEFGWRGYLQPRLFPGRPLAAAVVTGLIWGVWHFPLILRGYDFPDSPWLGALIFPVSAILLSIIFGWLKERVGSIWVTSLAHASTNAVGGSLLLFWFYGQGNTLFVSYLGFLGWLPLGLVAAGTIVERRYRQRAG
jgi:uncharacterized protein